MNIDNVAIGLSNFVASATPAAERIGFIALGVLAAVRLLLQFAISRLG